MKRRLVLVAALVATGCVWFTPRGRENPADPASAANAFLSALDVSQGSLDPVFDAMVYEYAVYVSDSLDSVTVTPTASSAGAVVSVAGIAVDPEQSHEVTLGGATTGIDVIVVSADGQDTKTYTLTVNALPGGSLDPSFGDGGVVVTDVDEYDDFSDALLLDVEGRIYLAAGVSNGANVDFALLRFTDTGDLDTGFGGGNGSVILPVGPGADHIGAAAWDREGRIVLAGYYRTAVDYDIAVARMDAEGALDETFGLGGVATFGVGPDDDTCTGIHLDAQDRITIAGSVWDGSDYGFALARLTGAGELDADFGDNGIVTEMQGLTDWPGFAVDSSGRYLLAGSAPSATFEDFAVVRFTEEGAVDPSFGTGGTALISIGPDMDRARALLLDSHGRILVAGDTYVDGSGRFGLSRLDGQGAPDSTFGTSGIVSQIVLARCSCWDLAVDGEGRILLVGHADNNSNFDFATLRYDSGGALDVTFGSDGIVTTAIGAADDYAFIIAIDALGRILVAGRTHSGADWDIAIARYVP